MSRVLTLAWKEWRLTVDTPLGYVIATAFLLASGFLFGSDVFLVGQAEMRGYFGWLPLLFMFFIPAMAMRLLAEERRSGTFELLATLPVRTVEIVLGKFLALLSQVATLLGLTLLYPASLALLGNVDGGQVAASYVAALLLAAAFSAICLFASALTRNAVVAYVVGFALLFALFLITQAAPRLPAGWQQWIEAVSPVRAYVDMLRGVLGLDRVVLLLALGGGFLAAAWLQLERRRWR